MDNTRTARARVGAGLVCGAGVASQAVSPICGTSNLVGICPPVPFTYYTYPPVGVSTNINIGNNSFSTLPGQTQTLYVADPGHWWVTSNAATGNTQITGYPSLGMWFPETPLTSYSSVVSSFSENGNYTADTISDTGYDLWFTTIITPDIGGPTPPIPASGTPMTNTLPYPVFAVVSGPVTSVVVNAVQVGTGPGSYQLNTSDVITLTYTAGTSWIWNTVFDVFLQHDLTASPLRGGVTTLATPSFPGSLDGITWNVGRAGRETIFQLTPPDTVNAGTVDVIAMITWLVANGRMDPAATMGLCGYGFEICSTGGIDETFQLNYFSWTQVFAEKSPALELSGFPVSGIRPAAVINSVTVSVTEHQTTEAANPVWFELWDYSGTPAQIGNSIWFMPGSTAPGNVTAFQFTGVTYAMLATLRVRIYGRSPAGSGYSQAVDSVSLTVNYQP
jgi:hypothetical protein